MLSAQSPLNVFPVASVGYYGWNTPPPITSVMFNLNVTSQVTLQAISTLLSTPVGQEGTLEFWVRPTWAGSDGRARVFLKLGDAGGILFCKDGANNLRSIFNR